MNVVIIILVVGALAVLIFKRFSNVVYYIGIVDIFLRILSFIAANIPIKEISNFIYTYFPSSVPSIINMYSSGIFNTILMWVLCLLYIFLDIYLIKIFWKKKIFLIMQKDILTLWTKPKQKGK